MYFKTERERERGEREKERERERERESQRGSDSVCVYVCVRMCVFDLAVACSLYSKKRYNLKCISFFMQTGPLKIDIPIFFYSQ